MCPEHKLNILARITDCNNILLKPIHLYLENGYPPVWHLYLRHLLRAIATLCLPLPDQFNRDKGNAPMFKVHYQYIKFVLVLLGFIRATREGIWDLHLSSLEELCKYFFALDRQKYARMLPLYIADMKALQTSDPDIWDEFQSGNFVVNKNEVALNANACARYFLIAHEMTRLVDDIKNLAGLSPSNLLQHHELSPTLLTTQETKISKLKCVIERCCNPFNYAGQDLINLVNQTVMPENVVNGMCNLEKIGQEKYQSFIQVKYCIHI